VVQLELARSSAARKSEACADGDAIDRRALSGMGTVRAGCRAAVEQDLDGAAAEVEVRDRA
jgi:hypothetical protein